MVLYTRSKEGCFTAHINAKLTSKLSDQQATLLGQLQELAREAKRVDSDRKAQLENLTNEVKLARQDSRSTFTQADLDDIAVALSNVTTTASEVEKEYRILDSLWFRTLKVRQRKITTAYSETFDWIFMPTSRTSVPRCGTVRFPEWLRSGDGVFWVSGKAGSGKSTLMKYLISHPDTDKNLQAWANGHKLVTASYFFWNAGTEMEKSQEGLLQSLLHEVLRKCPKLTEIVCPARWDWINRDFVNNGPWDLDELAATMDRLAHQRSMSAKFCFFVDGLDEYDGNHSDIIRILHLLTRSPNVKICLSSRPWNIFEDAYGRDAERKLYLQDLTRGDMEHYTSKNLGGHLSSSSLLLDETLYEELVEETVNRSQGVFLWIFLVVSSLCEGFTDGDSVRTLRTRLERLPTGLEEFFRHILECVDDIHHEAMALTFQQALEATETLPLLGYSFLDEHDVDFALKLDIQEMTHGELASRHASMRRRLNGRCKGLLEVVVEQPFTEEVTFWGIRVDFLHRTVRDFLKSKEVQTSLAHYVNEEHFNTNSSLCRMYLALIKTMPKQSMEDISNRGIMRQQLDKLMHHARLAEMELGKSDRELLDGVEQTLAVLFSRDQCYALKLNADKITLNHYTSYEFASVFELSVASGLNIYVTERLREVPSLTSMGCRPILGYALRYWRPLRHLESDLTSMVQLIFEHGVDANAEYHGSTTWCSWLLRWDRDFSSPTFEDRRQVFELLLQHGADPNRSDSVTGPITLWEHILQHFLFELRNLRNGSQATWFCQVIETLLCHNANPYVIIDSKFPGARHMTLADIFSRFPPVLAARLQARLKAADPASIPLPESNLNSTRSSISEYSLFPTSISRIGTNLTEDTLRQRLIGYLKSILQSSPKGKSGPSPQKVTP